MQPDEISKWEKLHKDSRERTILSEKLAQLWDVSDRYNIDYKHSKPETLPTEKFKKIKSDSKKLYVSANSILIPLVNQNTIDYLGAIIFSIEGCILKLYGGKDFLAWASEKDIKQGDVWDEKKIGANIFTYGSKTKEYVHLDGAENYSEFLIEGCYYFSPIILEKGLFYGGLALVVPYHEKSKYLKAVVTSIAREIELQIVWLSITETYFNIIEEHGIIILDQSKNENRILTMSKEVFKILKLPYRTTFYEHLEDVIAFNQDNRSFWDIVNNREVENDKLINMTNKGTNTYVSVTTMPFREDKFHMDGLIISLTSSKRISKIVTKYSGSTSRFHFEDIIYASDNFKAIIEQSKLASKSESNILLLGESGVGKEVLAQAIHNNSSRREGPFVAINCASFSKELIGSELFGYEEGAFTGAKKGGSIGKFELAKNGTLFLDEIGDMPIDLQAILLRVLEQRIFTKVGGNNTISTNVRIIAATNKNLYEKIAQSMFRDDLFYRLGVVRIHIPPLRERREDILLLANFFIKNICERVNKPVFQLSEGAAERLYRYNFPGNVRELQNLLEGIINTTNNSILDESTIIKYLGYNLTGGETLQMSSLMSINQTGDVNLTEMDDEQRIKMALRLHRNNKTKAAEYLGISRKTLYNRLEEYGIEK